jgi:Tfp pilus assembly protein PilX
MRALRRDDGFALVLALACIVVFGIMTAAAIAYTTSNQQAAGQSSHDLQALQYAEAGLNDAYSTLMHANASGNDPTAAGLLGTSTTPLTFCITAAGCTADSQGTATVIGCYGGNNGATCAGVSPSSPASTWVISATGYAVKPGGQTVARTMTAKVVISPLSAGAVAAVWNHVFVTAPLTANTCALNFGGNSTNINVPLYVIGNLCLPGNTSISETAGGQAIDVEVGGKLYMQSGSSTHVGASAASPITSGVVVGGCTTVSVADTNTHPCDGSSPSYNYWVRTADTFVPNSAPSETPTDIQNDYNTFSPGPLHPCTTSTGTPPTFDSIDSIKNGNNPIVNLTPTSSYSCTTSSGQLSWNNTTGILTIAGSIFFDGNVTMSQSAVYTGTAVMEMSGAFAMSTNNISLCAVSGCSFTSWQGSSGNNSMLTIAPVIDNQVAISMSGNSETFQGSMWTQPDASVSFTSNSTTIQGPISVGSISSSLNNTVIEPLPVIKNMPVGAPIPPNTSVSIGSLAYIK